MKAKKILDRVLLLVAGLLVFVLAAVLLVRGLKDKTEDTGVIFVAVNETVTGTEMSELELSKESEEALIEVDHYGRDLPELIDIYPVPTVDPLPASVSENDSTIENNDSSESAAVASTAVTTLQMSDYEIFLNPPAGSHDVDLTLFVSPSGGVNLRSEASADSVSKQVIAYGSRLHVVKVEGSWVQVKLSGGDRGFIAREYLQAIKPPEIQTTVTQPVNTAEQQVNQTQASSTPVPTEGPQTTIAPNTTVAPTTTQAPTTTEAPKVTEAVVSNPAASGFLLGISNPNPNYSGRPLQVEDRDFLERLVMAEYGNDYTGAVLVSQAIRDSMLLDGIYNASHIARKWGYTARVSSYVNDSTKRAVAYVFDEGGSAVQHSIYYFYNYRIVTNTPWHESQVFVVEYGSCRFFSRR